MLDGEVGKEIFLPWSLWHGGIKPLKLGGLRDEERLNRCELASGEGQVLLCELWVNFNKLDSVMSMRIPSSPEESQGM